jgi:predicted ferric reductase
MSWRPFVAIAGIIIVSVIVTLAEIPSATWLSLAALSLSMGVAALALMAAAAILGGRWRFMESVLGGLDRVYLTHKWMAVCALALAAIHFTFKPGMPEWETASILTIPPFWTRLVRQLALLALVLIVMLALNRKIPYHRWRWWHKLSGPLFLIVVLHWLSFKSPIAALSGLGVIAAFYKLVLYPILSPHAEYRVVGANPGAGALHLELAPVRNPIAFKPGQFAFISIKEDGLREPHPFTIASAPTENGHVHFMIRNLGDYTNRLITHATPGMHATVYAPFGRFNRRTGCAHEVWIAGGVGISPFLAWLTDEDRPLENVTLFYFFTPGREFPSAARLSDMAQQRRAEFVPIHDGPMSPEFARRFAQIAREAGSDQVNVSFCGPKGLLRRIQQVMRENGIPEANLHYEYFEFR